ncbi:hypothetical protein [Nocardioides houyundeii]|uniref:hypothetical protein n=1 Tax=Nocardioides houyundeii TaxID=2045452 RepID=UPI0013B44F06|nr:hypothetical protein [Nocardioides houyundeii]
MHRLHRRVVLVLGRRVVLVVGLLCLSLGSVGALFIGSDDTIGVGATHVSGAATGLPVVTYPVFSTLGGAEMAVTAKAAGGVYVASAHRVDVTDLLDGVRHYEIKPLSRDDDGRIVEGQAVRLRPGKIVGWRQSSSGQGEQQVIVPLDEEPVGVVAMARKPSDRVLVSFGVHVGGLFLKAIIIAGAGLLLIAAWAAARWRRRRIAARGDGSDLPGSDDRTAAETDSDVDSDTDSDTDSDSDTGRVARGVAPRVPAPAQYDVPERYRNPPAAPAGPAARPSSQGEAAEPPPRPITPARFTTARSTSGAATSSAATSTSAATSSAATSTRIAPQVPAPRVPVITAVPVTAPVTVPVPVTVTSSSTELVSLRAVPPPTRPTPGRMGATAVAVMALAWGVGRVRKRFLGLFLALFLLSGCGTLTGTAEEPSQVKAAVQGSEVDELVQDYLNRHTRAAKRAAAPTYDGSRWPISETGPLLRIAQYQAVVDSIAKPATKARRREVTAGTVYSPTFAKYPMWAAVVLEGRKGTDLTVFTRQHFAEPWLASASARIRGGRLPDPVAVQKSPSRTAITRAIRGSRAVQAFWATGEAPGLEVGRGVRRARQALLDTAPGSVPQVTEWLDPIDQIRMVQTAGGHLMVALHDIRLGTTHSVLTTALFVPANGDAQVLGSSLGRVLD